MADHGTAVSSRVHSARARSVASSESFCTNMRDDAGACVRVVRPGGPDVRSLDLAIIAVDWKLGEFDSAQRLPPGAISPGPAGLDVVPSLAPGGDGDLESSHGHRHTGDRMVRCRPSVA